MYRLFNEYGEFMRIVKRKEEAEHFVKFYGWTMKFFKKPSKEIIVLQQMEEAPL